MVTRERPTTDGPCLSGGQGLALDVVIEARARGSSIFERRTSSLNMELPPSMMVSPFSIFSRCGRGPFIERELIVVAVAFALEDVEFFGGASNESALDAEISNGLFELRLGQLQLGLS